MAAPSFVQAGTGNVITGTGATLLTNDLAPTTGNVIVLHVLQDGTGADATLDFLTSGRVENLAGTDDTMTAIHGSGGFDVGSPAAAKQLIWIGRFIGGGGESTTARLTSSSGNDLYARLYEFSGVHTGATLADVIENSTAGTATNGVGTSTTIADTAVVTLGADRLACNFVAVNDDNLLDAFASMSGGTWAEAIAEFAEATGTDGAIGLQIATMASAGTIDGGTDTMAASDGWGVVGFALKPAVAAPPASLLYRPRPMSRNI
jgi:hypothetical protein